VDVLLDQRESTYKYQEVSIPVRWGVEEKKAGEQNTAQQRDLVEDVEHSHRKCIWLHRKWRGDTRLLNWLYISGSCCV
jgi:hypothetical protein